MKIKIVLTIVFCLILFSQAQSFFGFDRLFQDFWFGFNKLFEDFWSRNSKLNERNIEEYISNYKNEVNPDQWKTLLDGNQNQLQYVSSIIQFFDVEKYSIPNSTYSRTLEKVKTYDRGDLLFGLYTDYENKNWVISNLMNYAEYRQYRNFVDNVMRKIMKAKLTYVNSGMKAVEKEYMLKYHLIVLAGLSGGWHPYPDAKLQHKRMNAEESLRYAFRINQQKLRHALLQHYINELYELKEETMGFINFVKELCQSNSEIFQRPDEIDDIPSVSALSDEIWCGEWCITKCASYYMICCTGQLSYDRVLQGMRNLANFLFELNQRELSVLCTQASLLAWQSNLLMTMNELRLSQLSALFNLLQNLEK